MARHDKTAALRGSGSAIIYSVASLEVSLPRFCQSATYPKMGMTQFISPIAKRKKSHAYPK
jgi:hypothetical protein